VAYAARAPLVSASATSLIRLARRLHADDHRQWREDRNGAVIRRRVSPEPAIPRAEQYPQRPHHSLALR